MTMKYHKIRNIPLETCTAEQKIAYNIAFDAERFAEKYRAAKQVSEICAADVLQDIIDFEFRKIWMPTHGGKYNDDAIFSCLRAGLGAYLEKPFIASGYEQIGKAFPAYYLK